MQAQRLPGKPLKLIAGKPMIEHVWQSSVKADIGPVMVATSEQEIVDAIESAGGQAVLTDPALPSGTDRVFAAWQSLENAEDFDIIINVQGDLPTLDPSILKPMLDAFKSPNVDIVSLAAKIEDEEEITNPNVVKIAMTELGLPNTHNAHYFSRSAIPSGGPYYHHIGIYAYRKEALKQFTSLPASPLEQSERLEQLRALEAGMTIWVQVVDSLPFGVDTEDDYRKACSILEGAQHG